MRDGVRANRWRRRAALIAALAGTLVPQALRAGDFEDDLARVDRALRNNPSGVAPLALKSCRSRRDAAVRYERMGQHDRADQALAYCLRVLKLPEPKS